MDILNAAAGMFAGGQGNNPVAAILQILQQQPGGIPGLINQFQQGGLGTVIHSWISTGENHPVTPEQLNGILSEDQVNALAEKLGTDREGALAHLAEHLPAVINHLSPEGSLPAEDDLKSRAENLLSGLLKRD